MSLVQSTLDIQARYRLAETFLPHNVAEMLGTVSIEPVWHADGDAFCYPRSSSDGGREQVCVDPHTRTVTVAGIPAAPEQRPHGEVTSPDGRWVAYVQDHNVFVRSQDSGQVRQLTTDGIEYNAYAGPPDVTASRVVLDALELRPSPLLTWSPDSSRLLTHRIDERAVASLHLSESTPRTGGRPTVRSQRLAMPGELEVPTGRWSILDVDGGEAVEIADADFPVTYASPLWFGQAWWSPDGQRVLWLQFDRPHRRVELLEFETSSRRLRSVFAETGSTYLDVAPQLGQRPNLRVLEGSSELVWWSERDGWGHLYLVDTESCRIVRQLTDGPWLVRELVYVDEPSRQAYFTGAGRLPGSDPYLRQFYRVGLDDGLIEPLTSDDWDHSIAASPSGRYFIDTSSTVSDPPVISLIDRDASVVLELERTDCSGLMAHGWSPPERFRVKAADGVTDIYGVLYRPVGFIETGSYPVVEQLYPGPQSIASQTTFALPGTSPANNNTLSMAALGFVVLTVDGRGTALRSKTFHDASYGALGDAGNLDDHVAALRQLAADRPWMDLSRVGAYGHSGGGYATVRALLTHRDVYRVGVASAGNHDQRIYHAMWGEKYQGPVAESDYVTQANCTLADQLTGRLLLIHGELDDNVHPAMTLRLVDAFMTADKDVDLMIVPRAEHMLLAHQRHWVRRRWDYLVRHLTGVDPPADFRLSDGLTGIYP